MLPDFSKSTLVDLLQARASAMGDRQAFRFLSGRGEEEQSVTYSSLHQRAMAIAGELQALAAPGDRALLLYPPGLDFVAAFFGCSYAGIVAVPAAPPGRNRATSSVEAIFDASSPSLILSTTAHRKLAEQSYSHLSKLFARPWVATDGVEESCQHAWRDPHVDSRQIAFLQYTSGSTSSPKGVVLSHENLLSNAALICQAFGNTSESSAVFWLPLYHDMGLIGGVLQPIYCGGSCTLLAPATFLQRPALWLETISSTRATVSGGPDFAYDLCVRKISAAERENLDLSSWHVAFTGAERVRAETIERFASAFAPCGFRREAFFPCYGLAEATLMVSGGPRQSGPAIVCVDADALARNRVQEVSHHGSASANGNGKGGSNGNGNGKGNGKGDSPIFADTKIGTVPASRRLVGCGQCLPGQRVVIVDPQTCLACKSGEVGEIWVQGPSVASGYHGRPDATRAAFGGRLADTGDGPFLRTGDLGFLRDGQLYVTGRLKDVIIIRGRNYYPEDIERSVEGAHAAFRTGYCAAFSVDVDNWDRLVVVQEIDPRRRDLDADAAVGAVRRVVAAEHELEVYAIVLTKAAEIPKTSSGKTRRSACRERYLRGELEVVAKWQAHEYRGDGASDVPMTPRPDVVTAVEVERWLIERIATRLRLPLPQVRVTTPFLEFGMGSVDAVEIAAELERWLNRRMSPTAIYNHPNIAALAQWLTSVPTQCEPSTKLQSAPISVAEMDPEQLLCDVQSMTEEEMQAFITKEMAKAVQE